MSRGEGGGEGDRYSRRRGRVCVLQWVDSF